MQIFDISVPIRPDMVIFQGNPGVSLTRVLTLARGDGANVSRLEMGTHTGSHIDAPVHFFDGAAGVEAVPLDACIGPAYVADASAAAGDVDAAVLAGLGIPPATERLLLKTRNSRFWDDPRFHTDFAGVTEDGARWLIARGIRLVAIDYLSMAPFGHGAPTHHALLGAGVVILEGVDLRRVEPGHYRLVALPLLIEGSDGGPTRAVLLRDQP
jgi:arylformamidase